MKKNVQRRCLRTLRLELIFNLHYEQPGRAPDFGWAAAAVEGGGGKIAGGASSVGNLLCQLAISW